MPPDEFDDIDPQEGEITPPVTEIPAAIPQYLTKDDLGDIVAQVVAALKVPAPTPAPTPQEQEEPTWLSELERKVSTQTQNQVLEMQKPYMLASVLTTVAGDLPENVRNEMSAQLMELDAGIIARITLDPKMQANLRRNAIGFDVQLNPARVRTPRSAPAGTIGGSTSEENDLTDKFMKEFGSLPGFSKEMAKKMAKDRM